MKTVSFREVSKFRRRTTFFKWLGPHMSTGSLTRVQSSQTFTMGFFYQRRFFTTTRRNATKPSTYFQKLLAARWRGVVLSGKPAKPSWTG